jgi:hypothetical protein
MPEIKLPKLSEALRPFVDLEVNLKSNIESATGLSLPPTPGEMAISMLESLESSMESVATGLPEIPTPAGLPSPGEVVKKAAESSKQAGMSSGKKRTSFKA